MKTIPHIIISGILSFLIVMSIGMFQVIFAVRHPDDYLSDFIEAGFPKTFFYFSIDGNGLQGFRLENFLIDFGIFFVVILICLLGVARFKKNRRSQVVIDNEF